MREITRLIKLLGITEDEAMRAILSAFASVQPGPMRQMFLRRPDYGSAPETSEIWDLLVRSNFRCSECGTHYDLTLDHRDRDTPNNKIGNLRVLCRDCNRAINSRGLVNKHANLRVYKAIVALIEPARSVSNSPGCRAKSDQWRVLSYQVFRVKVRHCETREELHKEGNCQRQQTVMNRGPGYVQTKKGICKNPPFKGLAALGLWYSFCLEEELHKWRSQCANARLDVGRECAAFCEHPAGYHIRRVRSDGVLLKVYDDRNQILDDTLLPVAVPGDNLKLLKLSEVVAFLKSRGAFYCRFAVRGLSHTGYVLAGRAYCAAWSDDQRGFLFETDKGPNPNAEVLERLAPVP